MSEELQRIKTLLDEAHVPREVWIGTDSTADRVEWVLRQYLLLKRQRYSCRAWPRGGEELR